MTLAALVPFPLLMYMARKLRRARSSRAGWKMQRRIVGVEQPCSGEISRGITLSRRTRRKISRRSSLSRLNKDYSQKYQKAWRWRRCEASFNPIMQGMKQPDRVNRHLVQRRTRAARRSARGRYCRFYRLSQRVGVAHRRVRLDVYLSGRARTRAAMRRIEEILSSKPEIAGEASRQRAIIRHPGHRNSDVSFAYERQRNGHGALEGVNFKLPVGRWVGLVGESAWARAPSRSWCRGSSMRRGDILMDGQDIRKLRLGDLRRNIGYVPQEPSPFFHLAQGRSDLQADQCSDEEIARAVRMSKLDRDLEVLPQGLETVVGERGFTLSSRQKQRRLTFEFDELKILQCHAEILSQPDQLFKKARHPPTRPSVRAG